MRIGALALALVLLTGSLARAEEPVAAQDPRPRSGVGGLVVGYAGLGIGVFNLATLPVCYADFYPDQAAPVCAGVSVAFGVGGLVAGVTGLVIGTRRRAAYKAWRARQTGARIQLRDMDLRIDDRQMGASVRFAF